MANIQWHKVTWYSKLIALIIFIVFPFIGFYWGIQYGEILQATNQGAPFTTVTAPLGALNYGQEYYGNPSEWQAYQSDNGGFTVSYPIDFPNTENYSSVAPVPDWRTNALGPLGTLYFTLTAPPAFEPQTNFADAKLTIGSSREQTAVAECLTPDATGGPAMPTSTAMINGIQFTIFKSADAGAGNYYEVTSYRTLHAGQCYAVEYTIHSSQIANYPASYDLHPFDQNQIEGLLQRIIGTFHFL